MPQETEKFSQAGSSFTSPHPNVRHHVQRLDLRCSNVDAEQAKQIAEEELGSSDNIFTNDLRIS
jgi:hypothetical protein